MGEIVVWLPGLAWFSVGNVNASPIRLPEIPALKTSIAVTELLSVKGHVAFFCRI